MTAKDRWTINLECKACGITGTARVSQEDGWAFKNNPETTIDGIEGLFSGIDGTKTSSPKFTCKNCGNEV